MAGPLEGVRIIELAGIGPGPFAGMLLADMGAEVIRVDRPGGNAGGLGHVALFRGRRAIAVDLKSAGGVETVLRLVEGADAVYEGYRPGVAERLGVGPEQCLARNPRVVYGRMTGWGQEGPYALAAGHDINYIALSGALHGIGRAGEAPVPPLNLVGDFGGGAMFLAFGLVCAILEARTSGKGQVVDAAMIDGSSILMQMFYSMRSQGFHAPERGTNMLDSGAPFYDAYETADGRWIALGGIEPQFYAELRRLMQLDDPLFDNQMDMQSWPAQKKALAEVVRTKTRDEWDAILAGSDACYAPVLDIGEAPAHPHNVARGSHVEVDGMVQAAPAPRFSRTMPATPGRTHTPGDDTRQVLADYGFAEGEIQVLIDQGAVVQN